MWTDSKGPELVQHVHSTCCGLPAVRTDVGSLAAHVSCRAVARTLFIGNTDVEHWFVINNKIRLRAQDMMTKPKYLSACYET